MLCTDDLLFMMLCVEVSLSSYPLFWIYFLFMLLFDDLEPTSPPNKQGAIHLAGQPIIFARKR